MRASRTGDQAGEAPEPRTAVRPARAPVPASAPLPGSAAPETILHLVTDLRLGGTQSILLERIRQPGRFRHAVLVFAHRTGQADPDPDGKGAAAKRGGFPGNASDLTAAFEAAGAAVYSLRLPRRRDALSALMTGVLDRRIEAVLAEVRPALLHSTLFHAHLLGERIARRAGLSHIASKEGTDDWMGALERSLEARALARAERVVAVSHAAARAARRLGVPVERMIEIPNGIDPARPGRWRIPAADDRDGPRLLGVGRCDATKGWEDLLRALPVVRSEIPSVRADLLLSGPAAHLARWRDEARRRGVAEYARVHDGDVEGTPEATVPSPPPLLVVPSREEGFGLVLVEGMARGLPVVATAVGGIPEIARHGIEALLVPPRDPRALAAAVVSLLRDSSRARALAVAARERAAQFTADLMVSRYHALYESLLPAKARIATAVVGGGSGDSAVNDMVGEP